VISINILGLEVPDSRPVFLTALAVHVTAGAVSVVAGAWAAFSRKRPGRHPRAGTVYLVGLATIFATATIMAALRWRHSWHLFAIACVAAGLGLLGLLARKRRWHRWMTWHGSAMGMSYVALLTGFYVDNGAQLPVWNRLPHIAYWFLPSVVGVPVIILALARNGALPRRRRRTISAGFSGWRKG
jgi:hypothetical protein